MWRSSLPHPPPHPTHTTTTTTPPSSRWEPSGLTIITSLLLHPATQHYHTTTPAHTSSFHLFLPFCTHQSPPPIKVGAFRPDQSPLPLDPAAPHYRTTNPAHTSSFHLFLPSCTHHTTLLKVGAFGPDHNHLSPLHPTATPHYRTTTPAHTSSFHLFLPFCTHQFGGCRREGTGERMRCVRGHPLQTLMRERGKG